MISDILTRQRNNEKIAVISKHNKYTYKEIFEYVKETAKKINDVQCRNVGLYIDNSIDYIIGYFTISYLHKVIVPIETNIKDNHILNTIYYCDIELVITNSACYPRLTAAISKHKLKKSITVYILDEYKIECILVETDNEIYNISNVEEIEKDVAIMLHTSGTTNNPKRVMLTHSNLLCNIKANIESLKLTENDRSLIVLPMCFGYCNTSQFLTHFYLGASIVIYNGVFIPSRFYNYIEDYSCTNTTCIPSMLFLLANNFGIKKDLHSLRYLCFGGGTMSSDILEVLNELLPSVGIIQTYGQTEAGPRITCLLPEDSIRKMGSVGKAIPGVSVKIIDERDRELPAKTEGEIVVSSPSIMKGYYKRPDETKKVIKNGWLYTGDIGLFDEDGYLYIVGRIKNVIITGGLNIYPEEIEEVLCSYPKIKEAVVLPKKHKVLGEVPIAHIVVEIGQTIEISSLIEFCKERLEIQKVPGEIKIVKKLEKTYNGKTRRKM